MGYFSIAPEEPTQHRGNSVTKIKEGEVKFEVLSAESTFSKTGNPMVVVKLATYDDNDGHEIVYDYLLQKFSWKVKAFLEAIGHLNWYAAGGFDTNDSVGKVGSCVIKLEPGTDGYKDRMVIAKYLPKQAQESGLSEPKAAQVPDLDDDVPF